MIHISKKEVEIILNETRFIKEPKVPFPQADSFTRIICICEHLLKSNMSADEIIELNKFTSRQKDYYTNAGIYLSLIEKYRDENKIFYRLSNRGKLIFELNEYERDLELCKCLCEHTVFHHVLSVYLLNNEIDLDEIVEIMHNHALYNVKTTQIYRRRGKTVLSWIRWVVAHFE